MKVLVSDRLVRNVLLPGWIMTFGLVALSSPPLGVTAGLSLTALAVLGVPALVLIPRVVGARAEIATSTTSS